MRKNRSKVLWPPWPRAEGILPNIYLTVVCVGTVLLFVVAAGVLDKIIDAWSP